MGKARDIRLTATITLPCWINEADLDQLERDIGLLIRQKFQVSLPSQVKVDVRSLEVL